MNIVACRDRKQPPNAMWRAYLAVTVFTDPNNTEKSPAIVGHAFLNGRYYDSQRGQFLSEDPVFWEVGQTDEGKKALTNPQAMNSYGYGNGNPVVNKDPQGKWGEISVSGVIEPFSGTVGVRFDGHGIDWFDAVGYGNGLEGGIQVGWAPGEKLSHQNEVSISINSEAADGAGVRGSRIVTYKQDSKAESGKLSNEI